MEALSVVWAKAEGQAASATFWPGLVGFRAPRRGRRPRHELLPVQFFNAAAGSGAAAAAKVPADARIPFETAAAAGVEWRGEALAEAVAEAARVNAFTPAERLKLLRCGGKEKANEKGTNMRRLRPVLEKMKQEVEPVVDKMKQEVEPVVEKMKQEVEPVVEKMKQEVEPASNVHEAASTAECLVEEMDDEGIDHELENEKLKFLDDLDSDDEDKENEKKGVEERDRLKRCVFTALGLQPASSAAARKALRSKHTPVIEEPPPPPESEYEKIRTRNIEERRKKLAELGILQFAEALSAAAAAPKRQPFRRRSCHQPKYEPVRSEPYPLRPRRSSRASSAVSSRSAAELNGGLDDDWDDDREMRRAGRGGAKAKATKAPLRNQVNCMDGYHSYSKPKAAAKEERVRRSAKAAAASPDKRRHNAAFQPNEDILQPEHVTPEMLKDVAMRVSVKTYCQTGTTCHQCRQKTLDQKTVCRSGRCRGVQGLFCGVCLHNRYGEDACEALLDAAWHCPPCRGQCNCSICRNRKGKGATGILIPLAKQQGFKSVHEYLKHIRRL